MASDHRLDWDPLEDEVLRDQRAAYDAMRESCPVAFSRLLHWSVFRHADVVQVLRDHQTFSNAVSAHRSVPNGMDPPEHTMYRQAIEPCFAPDRMAAFRPVCRRIVVELVESARAQGEVEVLSQVGRPFATRVQCAFVGWPKEVEQPLIQWIGRHHEAVRAQDRPALAELAGHFVALVDEQLERRLEAPSQTAGDATAELLGRRVEGRPLESAEMASIMRNWTVGEIGTIAASIGILAHYLATHPELQAQLRAQPDRLPEAIDEILRMDGPLLMARRVARRDVVLSGRSIAAGERLSIMWIAANRDGRAFEDPEEFRWGRDPAKNLLYGQGIHACPGAPLARLEMRLLLEELLARTTNWRLCPGRPARRAHFPAGGFEEVFVRLE